MSQANVNPDLLKERQKATFDVENLTNFIHGGRDRVKRKRYLRTFNIECV